MSGTSPTSRRSDPIARDVRLLPSNPNLEFERKNAKAFLKQLHAGDPDARRRVQVSHAAALQDRGAEQLQLADAQHVIAREYGFSSWPRLVEYFEVLDRHRHAPRYNSSEGSAKDFEALASGVVRRHQLGDPIAARELSHFVPRYFAQPIADILATPITMDDARLVIARRNRRVSWDELLVRGSDSRMVSRRNVSDVGNTPRKRAGEAIAQHDVAALTALLDAHPELLTPSLLETEWRNTLGSAALRVERESNSPDARRVTELLASRGVDIQRQLNEILLGWPQDGAYPAGGGMPVHIVEWCLERGADPEWTPPNGLPVLEHAIARYRNGAAVDLIAKRVAPRRALWIAAGLGDVAGVRNLIARKGRVTAEGRLNRPDLGAMGLHFSYFPPHHDADDLDIMYEAFQIAAWNERWDAMDALLDAGFPIDHSPFNWPLLLEAVGNMNVPLAEYLVSRGADLERDWPGRGSARAQARDLVRYRQDSDHGKVRRMLEICGTESLEQIFAAIDAVRQSPPSVSSEITRTLQLAGDDAARQGASSVGTEHILVGLLRLRDGAFLDWLRGSGTDMPQLHALIAARLLPDADPLDGGNLGLAADAEAALAAATAEADARRRDAVAASHLWHGVLAQVGGSGAQLLRRVGADLAKLSEGLSSGM